VLEQLVNAQLADSRRHRPLSLLLLDADHFKVINDEHGHAAGDQALRALVAAVRPQLRPNDLIGRLGGEEFLVVLSATPDNEALLVAERLRNAVATRPLVVEDGASISLSVSIGIATQAENAPGDFAGLVRRADVAMYEAKHAGRNCVRVATWNAAWPAPAASASNSLH
jgi:diguanylate cyclase (GGDEF)-like protein